MKGEKNIEHFIQKKMQEGQLHEEDWNVPSDDIWESAKPHFPKKKKRRGFLFLLVPGLLVASFAIAYFTLFNHSPLIVNTELVPIDKKESQSKEKAVAIEKKPAEIISLGEMDKVEKILTNIASRENENKEQVMQRKLESDENGITKSIESSSASKSKITIDEITMVNPVVKTGAESLDISTIFSLPITKNSTGRHTQSKKKNEVLESKEPQVVASFDAEQSLSRTELDFFAPLQGKEDEPILDNALPEFTPAFEPKLEMGKPMHKWELGLSYSSLLIFSEFLWMDEEELKEMENLSVGIKSFGANFSATRRFNRRWSLTSGLNFYNALITPSFEVEEIYEEGIGEASFRRVINDQVPVGAVVINDSSSELNVQLKPGVSLSPGDKTLVKGSIPLRLGMVQVPFIWNYHIGKRKSKFETILHAGLSVDYMYASIDRVDINVFQNNELISEPIAFDPFSEREFGLSGYIGGGFKYHLNDHLNIGLNSLIDVTSLVLTRANIGIFYGF